MVYLKKFSWQIFLCNVPSEITIRNVPSGFLIRVYTRIYTFSKHPKFICSRVSVLSILVDYCLFLSVQSSHWSFVLNSQTFTRHTQFSFNLAFNHIQIYIVSNLFSCISALKSPFNFVEDKIEHDESSIKANPEKWGLQECSSDLIENFLQIRTFGNNVRGNFPVTKTKFFRKF